MSVVEVNLKNSRALTIFCRLDVGDWFIYGTSPSVNVKINDSGALRVGGTCLNNVYTYSDDDKVEVVKKITIEASY